MTQSTQFLQQYAQYIEAANQSFAVDDSERQKQSVFLDFLQQAFGILLNFFYFTRRLFYCPLYWVKVSGDIGDNGDQMGQSIKTMTIPLTIDYYTAV